MFGNAPSASLSKEKLAGEGYPVVDVLVERLDPMVLERVLVPHCTSLSLLAELVRASLRRALVADAEALLDCRANPGAKGAAGEQLKGCVERQNDCDGRLARVAWLRGG